MSIEVQKVEVNEASILYQARTKLSTLATEIADARKLSSASSKLIQATKIRLMLKALDLGEYLTRLQRERIWYMLIEVAEIYDFPTAPILETRNRPDILLGYTVTNNYTGLSSLTHNNILIGDPNNEYTEVVPAGDVTITDAGVTAIGADKVTVAMIADAELKALAGLTSAANKIPYFTGSGTASVLTLVDEDNMASDSATSLPTQQSVKAYVDAQVGASGDVVGPASATDNAVARFDLTTGKLIQNSVVTIADTTGNMAGVGTLNTHTIPGGTGTFALTSDITGTNSGTNTGDQTITLTGDVTGTGTGSFTTAIGAGVIVNADINASAAIDASKIADGSVSSTEFQYINSLTSNAQTQLDNLKSDTIQYVISGGGAVISTGIVPGDIEVPFNCTITQATALADQSGSIVIDIWKDSYANFPPTDVDSITSAAPITISTATKSQDATLTGWTTSLTRGEILRFNVDSITSITSVTISLQVTKS